MRYKKNKVKHAVRAGRVVCGSWLNIPSLSVAEIMAQASFDFLVCDEEHGPVSVETIQEMCMVIEGYDCLPYVRVKENEPIGIKRMLEAGAYGIIAPMVNSKRDVEKLRDAVYYPPQGKRGVGLSRAQGYGLKFAEYKVWHKKELGIVAQIEHIEAIQNLEEILSVKELDATMIGPYDLSASLGKPGEFQDPAVRKALVRYEEVSKKMKKPYGYHVVMPDEKVLEEKKKKGYSFLVYGIDELFLKKGL